MAKNQKSPKALWGGRFSKGLHESAKEFSYSLLVDYALLGSDVKVSMAHALMLAKVGLIKDSEAKQIVKGLWKVLSDLKKANVCAISEEVEDVHTLIQNTLEKKIGKLAKKLHTARSRNDLVSTSTRLYVKDRFADISEKINLLQESLVSLAKKNEKVLMPGYTHLQRAQTVSFAHHLLAYVEMLERDKKRLFAVRNSIDECPLGACALSGSTLPIDRMFVAKMLGFKKPSANSIDAVSDRDFVIESLSAISILMMHLSRFSEDLILWNSQEFGFVTLSDEFSTGSSLMPHKKNPDMLELTRGKTGEAYGNLIFVLTMMKGLPLAYNRDMQEDKKPLFGSIKLALGTLNVLAGLTRTIEVNESAMKKAVQDSFLYATDLLEYLVARKVAFRDAHEIVGKLVQEAIESHSSLSGLSLDLYKQYSPKFGKDVFDLFDAQSSLNRKVTLGSPNLNLVRKELARWQKSLADEMKYIRKVQAHHA